MPRPPLPRALPLILITVASLFSREVFQNPGLHFVGKDLPGWRTKGLEALETRPTPQGWSLRFPKAPKHFLDWELGQPVTLEPGRYRLSIRVTGDPGTRWFAGMRVGKEALGPDHWVVNKGKEMEFTSTFHTGLSPVDANLFLGFGFKENEGKSMILHSISLTRVVPPTFPDLPTLPPLSLTVKPKGSPTPFQPLTLGHNIPAIDWHGSGKKESLFWDGKSGKPRPEWVDLVHAFPLHLVRFHFGNDYPWKDSVGPLSQRRVIRHDLWNAEYHVEAGIFEFLTWLESLPGKPQASLILSPLRPLDEITDLVAFVRATTGPMALLRSRCGHPAPFDVTYWELGNEVDWRGRGDLDVLRKESPEEKAKRKQLFVEEYIERMKPILAAVRRLDPKARLFPHVATSPWFHDEPDKTAWHRTILKEIGGQIDGLVIHPYYDGYPVPLTLTNVDLVRADMAALAPGRGLTLWVSEHAKWVNYEKEEERPQSWGLSGVLGTGDFLMQLFARPDVSAANYWVFVNRGPWRVINDDLDDFGTHRFGTGIHHTYRLFNRAAGKTWQALEVNHGSFQQHPAGYRTTVTAGIFRDGIDSLLAVNRSSNQSFHLPLPEFFRNKSPLKRLLVSGKSLQASPIPGAPEAVTFVEHLDEVVNTPNGPCVLLPPRSLAAWIANP